MRLFGAKRARAVLASQFNILENQSQTFSGAPEGPPLQLRKTFFSAATVVLSFEKSYLICLSPLDQRP
jgi:hypothetical protein